MTTSDQARDAAGPEEEEQPEDPRLRNLRRLVTMLLIVLIAGTLAVVIALLLKLKSISFEPSEAAAADIGLGAGESLVGAEATAERITLLIEDAETGARRIVILDAETYGVVGAVAAEEQRGAE